MYAAVLAIHLVVCLSLIGVILVQSGKGGGLAGGAFGGATQTVFGGRGATDFITRATIGLGVTFFITSLALALMTSNGGLKPTKSLIQEQAKKAQQAAPQVPSAPIANPASGVPQQGAAPAKGKR